MNNLKAGRYFTVGELATEFGVKRMTIYRWYTLGTLKPTMIGNLARFHESDISAFKRSKGGQNKVTA